MHGRHRHQSDQLFTMVGSTLSNLCGKLYIVLRGSIHLLGWVVKTLGNILNKTVQALFKKYSF